MLSNVVNIIEMALYIYGLSSINPSSYSNHNKNSKQIINKEHSIKYMISPSQKCQGHQKQGKSSKLLLQRGTKRCND